MKYLKSCLPEENLLDTAILLICISFIKIEALINVYFIYQNRAFILMKFIFFNFSIIKFYIFYPFLYAVLTFL